MKLKLIFSITSMTIVLFFFSCNDGDFPTRLNITGLPPSSFEGEIVSFRKDNSELLINVKTGDDSITLHLSPRYDNLFGNRLEDAENIKVDTTFLPDGPYHLIEISKDGSPYLYIGRMIRNNREILPGLNFDAGKIIGLQESGERNWIEIVVNNADEGIIAKPGRPINIKLWGELWEFILIGASVPVEEELESIVSSESENESILETDSGEISREEPGLVADWILFKS